MKLSSIVAGGMAMALTGTLPVALHGVAIAQSAHPAASITKDPAPLPVLPRPKRAASSSPTSGALLVKVSQRAGSRGFVERSIGRRAKTEPLGGRWFSVRGVRGPAVRERLASTPGVVGVQRERVRQVFGDRYYRRYQPYLRASMDINTAWSRSTGRGVKVAVLDSGVDAKHEDLPRVLRGRDFVSGDRNPHDPLGHGTFVAGVIAAGRDNQRGIAGVSRATILPGRVLNANGAGRDGTIAQAIRWAVRERADIINLSLGGGRTSRILRDAVEFATNHGVLVVASAGNNGGTRPMYPAAYPDALAVGATDHRDRMVWWSQHGDWVDVTAPGARIASTVPGDRYALGSGTSFSAPLVSGAAALVLDEHPAWTVDQLRDALLAGTADAGPVGPDRFTGLGVPDVDGMLGGPSKLAVPATGPLSGTAPANARALRKDSVVPASSPEGTDRWFELDVDSAQKVSIAATLRSDRAGAMRGDVELSLFDVNHRRLDVADARRGEGTEHVRAVVDDNVYLRVRNLADTRWPVTVKLGLSRESANPGAVETGVARPPVLIASTPMPEAYGGDPSLPIELTTGVDIKPASIDAASVRLLDGDTGEVVASSVTPDVNGWVVTPDAPLANARTYTVVLNGLRTTGGETVPYTRVGFRTAL